MSNLLTQNKNALQILMTEDLYILSEHEQLIPAKAEQSPETGNLKLNDEQTLPVAETPVQQTEVILPQKAVEAQKIREFSYLGENNKYFLILFNEPDHKEISSIQKETLLKIMSAKGLLLRDLLCSTSVSIRVLITMNLKNSLVSIRLYCLELIHNTSPCHHKAQIRL